MDAEIYSNRFSAQEIAEKGRVWVPICRYLQRYVNAAGTTLDLGAGPCHFINNIESCVRLAVDTNEQLLHKYAHPNVHCIVSNAADLSAVLPESVDTVFASNVYEHFHTREDVALSLREVHRVLRPGGRFIVIQPNFRYCWKVYSDYFDHRLVFTHKGMAEGIRVCGFQIELIIDRFLPYTSKSWLPQMPWLVRWYLRLPTAWRWLGTQMLLVARK